MNKNTSNWDKVADWYKKVVDVKGMYYHKQIIFPNLLRFLDINQDTDLVDLASGEGVFSRYIHSYVNYYLGIDQSSKLISYAIKLNKYKNVNFRVLDLTKDISTINKIFSHAVCILAVQNIKNIDVFFRNAAFLLKSNGIFVIVMNHPCFRIPRVTSWGIDLSKKLQFRRIDRYMSPLNIPINVKPSKLDNRYIAWTYHYPLSYYVNSLSKAGFLIKQMEEWISDKKSVGKYRKMENLARSEIPLFLAIKAIKIT